MSCFLRMLNELKDIAGQHELVAENIEERVILKLDQLLKSLKDERKRVKLLSSHETNISKPSVNYYHSILSQVQRRARQVQRRIIAQRGAAREEQTEVRASVQGARARHRAVRQGRRRRPLVQERHPQAEACVRAAASRVECVRGRLRQAAVRDE